MSKIRSIVFASAFAGAIGIVGGGSAQALTLGNGFAPGVAGQYTNPMIEQVQRRRFRGGGARRGGGVVRRGRGRGFGTGAAIGLGILGLGLAGAAAAANSRPAYDGYRECWWERRAVYNEYGDFMGRRRVRVCN